jgi:TolA-binding protein
MNKPGPSDNLGPLRARLLQSARADAPPPGARQRSLVALGFATAAVTAPAGSALAAWAARNAIWKWVLLGAMGGVVTTTAVKTIQTRQQAEPETIARAVAPMNPDHRPAGSSPPRLVAETSPLDNPEPIVSSPAPSLMPAPAARAALASSEPEQPCAPAEPGSVANGSELHVAPAASLTREVELLDQARAALRDGETGKSMQALDRYARECPSSQLAHEAIALQVEALLARGDCAQAATVGQRFLAQHDRSPQAPRIRELLARGCRPAAP